MEAVVPLIETMVPPTVGSRPLARKIVLAGASAGAWLPSLLLNLQSHRRKTARLEWLRP